MSVFFCEPTTRCRKSAFGILFAATVLIVSAALPAAAAERWYQVEVIVFRHIGSNDAELRRPIGATSRFDNAVSLITDVSQYRDGLAGEANVVESNPGPIAFAALSSHEMKTAGVYRRLKSSGAYQPVVHVGWRQPGYGGRRAREVYISDRARLARDVPVPAESLSLGGETQADRIEGTIRVNVGRTLHLAAKFSDISNGEVATIDERRKVKLKELHYFDNPHFGVIVQITPYRVEPFSGEEPETDVE